MSDNDHDRIAKKAHELWEAEGHPHGRDQDHWDQAKEIIALQDSMGDTLLSPSARSGEPVEEMSVAVDNEGQAPGLTDTGEHDLTDISREPAVTAPSKAAVPAKKPAAAKRAAEPRDMTRSEAPAKKPAKSAKKGR